ncbi:MAG: DUF2846 domain-containing protein [Bdellovibrionota bacterium]
MKYWLLILVLSSCAYPKKTTPFILEKPNSDKATVYLYRTYTQADSLNPDVPWFYINDNKIGKLSLGGYYVQQIDPGEATVYYKDSAFGRPLPWKGLKIKFPVKANESYYVKFSIEGLNRKTDLLLVPNVYAEKEITQTQLLKN